MSDNIDAGAAVESSPEQSAQEVIETIDAGAEEGAEEIVEAEGAEAGEELLASDESVEEVDVEDASNEELEEVIGDEDASEEEVLQAQQELKKRLTLKVNGEEFEEEIDFADDDKLREILQKGYAADNKFQEAANLKKQVEGFVRSLQENPLGALKELGYDLDDLTDGYMQQRIADLEKTPEQLRIEELQRELDSERKMKEEQERLQQEEELRAAEENFSRKLDNDITQALTTTDLPQSTYVVKRIADNLITAFELGYEDISVQDIMPVVESQIKGEIQQMFEAMPEDVVEKVLGNKVSTKLRKRRITKAKKAPKVASSVKSTGKAELKQSKSKDAPEKPVNSADFFKNIGSF